MHNTDLQLPLERRDPFAKLRLACLRNSVHCLSALVCQVLCSFNPTVHFFLCLLLHVIRAAAHLIQYFVFQLRNELRLVRCVDVGQNQLEQVVSDFSLKVYHVLIVTAMP